MVTSVKTIISILSLNLFCVGLMVGFFFVTRHMAKMNERSISRVILGIIICYCVELLCSNVLIYKDLFKILDADILQVTTNIYYLTFVTTPMLWFVHVLRERNEGKVTLAVWLSLVPAVCIWGLVLTLPSPVLKSEKIISLLYLLGAAFVAFIKAIRVGKPLGRKFFILAISSLIMIFFGIIQDILSYNVEVIGITISFVLYFTYIAFSFFSDNVDSISDVTKNLQNYQKAILAESLISLEVDLTTDTLLYGEWKDDDGNSVPLKNILGLTIPCSYSTYIKMWQDTFVESEDKKTFSVDTDRVTLLKLFKAGKSEISLDYDARTITGREAHLRRTICMLKNTDDHVISYTNVKDISDIGRLKKKEIEHNKELEDAMLKAEAANNAKSAFLFNMSHDIRTPMNAILGFTRIAKDHIKDEQRVMDSLDKINLSGNQLLALINEVLEMSRIESGKIEIKDEPSDMNHCLDDINPMLSSSAEEKGVTYITELKNITDRYVWMDHIHCNRVLVNLISNAIKYTPKGGKIHVLVQQVISSASIAMFVFKVTDTGIGMKPEFLSQVFEPFAREKTSTIEKIQGTGLGLSIAKRITDLMEGTIEVESTVGKGSVFTVTVPFRKMTQEDIAIHSDELNPEKKKNTIEGEESLNGKKVLLVEDNEFNREIAVEILTEQGITVTEAEDGSVAVSIMKDMFEKGSVQDYFDFILMDIQMPIMDGYTASREIRALHDANGTHIPIIAMTANAFAEDKEKAFESGMDAHLSKPVDVQKLKQTMIALNNR